ncbi:uncharacterized protein LOC106095615 [Stomoxys calcitrans]|uniref:uncharacterized protein LOC106095615 n=1 Tax=Stomoxys calcitrans TaxID=35570 RepID=UPI0027E244DF|nr:uncharacterized protein LOC106095615 [Stomoxys calcitrans]
MERNQSSNEQLDEDIESLKKETKQLSNEHFNVGEAKSLDSIAYDLGKIPNADYVTQSTIDRYIGSKQSLSVEEIRIILRDSRDSILKQFKSQCEHSNAPSFSQLRTPYHLICRERYRLTKKLSEQQMQLEIQEMINHQPTTFDAICFVRVMAITSLWPPLHTRPNVDHTHQHYFQLSAKQKRRLNYIMQVDWSKT